MKFELMQNQKEAVDLALKNNGVAAFFHEVGCGKTISALSTFQALRKKNPNLSLMVICPLSLIYGAWTREIDKFFPQYNWIDLHDNELKDRRRRPDIFLLNFEYLMRAPKFEKVKSLISSMPGWMCAIDESSKMKNHDTITVKRVLELKNMFDHRIIMSGTPAPNIEWEYWSQMFFLSETILGRNFYKFKNMCFALRRGKQQCPQGVVMNRAMIRKMHKEGFKYEIIPQRKEEMFERMRPWCHMVKAADCLDLPEEIDEFRDIKMTPVQQKVYKQMEKHYIAELSGVEDGQEKTFVVADVVLSKMMKLRQITSGFAINDDNKSVKIDKKNPKINALLDLVEECGDHQMIIWCHFHWEIDAVTEVLSEFAGVSQLHGRIAHKKKKQQLDGFLDGTNRFLVAHPASAAHGLTLVNCRFSVFFSLDCSMEKYSQARGRVYRKGQENNCVYFHLIVRGTVDEDALNVVTKKKTRHEIAMEFLKR